MRVLSSPQHPMSCRVCMDSKKTNILKNLNITDKTGKTGSYNYVT